MSKLHYILFISKLNFNINILFNIIYFNINNKKFIIFRSIFNLRFIFLRKMDFSIEKIQTFCYLNLFFFLNTV
jgi:hypothetical protein